METAVLGSDAEMDMAVEEAKVSAAKKRSHKDIAAIHQRTKRLKYSDEGVNISSGGEEESENEVISGDEHVETVEGDSTAGTQYTVYSIYIYLYRNTLCSYRKHSFL